jgi:hypothetical protein
MPPAWVDFCRVLVREKRDNVKQISVVIVVCVWSIAVMTHRNKSLRDIA